MKRCQEDRGAEGAEGGDGNIFHLGTQGSFLEKVSDQLPISDPTLSPTLSDPRHGVP